MPCRFRRSQMPRARLRASGPLGQLPSRLSDRHARGFTSAAATCQPSEFEKARGSFGKLAAGGKWIRTCMGLFLSSLVFVWRRFFVRSGKAVLRPVACDQVRGARGRGQGTETVAKLGGLPA